MTTNDFLIEEIKDKDLLYKYYIEYLEGILKESDFPYTEQVNFKSLSKKFLESISAESFLSTDEKNVFLRSIDDFLISISKFQKINNYNLVLKFWYSNKKKLVNEKSLIQYSQIKEKSLDYILGAKKYRKIDVTNISINDFYKPENVDRTKIKNLLREAIELITLDENITLKTKEKIINQILQIIENLDKNYYSITSILGNISEIMIILGGLGSFISGITPLFQAKEKLQQTQKIIQDNSININQKVIDETFNIKNIESLNYINQNIYMIENNKESENND